ncbi:MAG: RdgB/HAM1 family non-canonical purine NTP pyrophosphatase [Alphaproteobacteria bacterium]|nr:MAG: RdgB/HAM1 family non-canonical purine NTP pyrophosphatase [Alphaproteobacteria bacterium]
MARQFTEPKLVIASHNAGKVREIGDLLRPFDTDVVSAGDLDIEEPEETGTTFVANASLKARASAQASGLPALADDSGLAVVALNGDPGIYSARWGGPDRDFNLAMQKVEEAVQATGNNDRRAYFVCALCLAWPDGHEEIFEGRVDGTLVWPGQGDQGFGYDPIFLPAGATLTFGQMDPDAKHAISHRADAFRQLVDACF